MRVPSCVPTVAAEVLANFGVPPRPSMDSDLVLEPQEGFQDQQQHNEALSEVIQLLTAAVLYQENTAASLAALWPLENPLNRDSGLKWYRELVYSLKVMSTKPTNDDRYVIHGIADRDEKLPTFDRGGYKVEDFVDSYGFTIEEFDRIKEKLFEWMNDNRPKVKECMRSREHCLKLTLYWMRKAETFTTISGVFNVPKSTAHVIIIRYIVYLRCAFADQIGHHSTWSSHPTIKTKNAFGEDIEVVGFLDGTNSDRDRVHPVASLVFRGDHDYPFLNVQIFEAADDEILDVAVGWGHNNDINMYSMTFMEERMEEAQVSALVDLGYEQSRHAITPESGKYKATIKSDYNTQQAHLRSAVEHDNSFLKNFAFLRNRTKVRPNIHAMAIVALCQLWNFKQRIKWASKRPNRFEEATISMDQFVDGPKQVRGVFVRQ